jgi:hypothetical protein
MNPAARNTTIFIAAALAATLAYGQNVYKCGNTYSQTPCADGKTVDVSDSRTPAQKAEADAATRRGAKAADAMERSRLREEAQLRAANRVAVGKPPTSADTKKAEKEKKGKKEKPPEYFTAREPDGKRSPPGASRR